jgi:putative ABC transport system permease protein
MYLGMDDELKNRYTADFTVTATFKDNINGEKAILEKTNEAIKSSGRTIKDENAYSSLSIGCAQDGNKFQFTKSLKSGNYDDMVFLCVMTRDDYEVLFHEELPEMGQHEAVISTLSKKKMSNFSLDGQEYTVKDTKDIISKDDKYMADMVGGLYYIVVNDSAAVEEINQLQMKAYGEKASNYTYKILIDIDGSRADKIACDKAVSNNLNEIAGNYKTLYNESRDGMASEFHRLYGGFLFLGLFLGTLFLMITVLIIFYKQISEGYDDKERFAIMEKVGMSSAEVKATISAQVKLVFFLPLVTAAIHVTAAFPMVRRLLMVLNLTNKALFAGCLAGTIVVFGIIYLIVFLLTSKSYYKIVGNQV